MTAPLLWKGAYPHSNATLISTSLLITPLFIKFSNPCFNYETGTALGSENGLFLISFGRMFGLITGNFGFLYLFLPIDLVNLYLTFFKSFYLSLSPLILGR